jgi:hypothetical protein
MATTNYSWNLPTVGGSEDTWGTQLNANWTAIDTLLGGVTNTEFAILDGATVTTAELNILDGATVTVSELNILDGATVTAAELNILDGATITTAELNILDGVTTTAAELNILDGAIISTTELNYLDGATSNIQTQIDSIVSGGGANNSTITITAGAALTGGGSFTLNQATNATLTVAHADTSSQSSVSNSGTSFIQSITLDTYGHVTAIASATASGARAWVNFNGTGSVAIRAALNVSSVTDNGTGDYTVNFTTSIGDANYAIVNGMLDNGTGNVNITPQTYDSLSSGSVRVYTSEYQGSTNSTTRADRSVVTLAVFR